MATKPLDALLDPSFVEGATSLSLEELRTRRTECHETEVRLSYLRRMIQGRLDIALAELQQRDAQGEPLDAAAMVEHLPEILADRVRPPGKGRLPMYMAPGEVDPELLARVDAIASVERLLSLGQLGEAEVRQTIDELEFYERTVSSQRRNLHAVIDRLQEEIVRRYKTGEATVDGLLGP